MFPCKCSAQSERQAPERGCVVSFAAIAMRTFLRREVPGLALLLSGSIFSAVFLAPELGITRAALNDNIFHLSAAERLLAALRHGEPFLDPWVSEWALGYPIWRSYQPLPHLMAALVLGATESFASHATAFAWLQYILLVSWPASVYAGARLLGLRPVAAGLAALLVLAPSGAGELAGFGLGYGAFVWRGSGLFTQLVALHALVLTLGVMSRALETGKHRGTAAAALAITGLCHIVFGYVAGLSAVVMAVAGRQNSLVSRSARLITIGMLTALLLLWFVVPLAQTADVINHSRWEGAHKWDSFGAPHLLEILSKGQLFDADRFPVLSLLLLLGLAAAVWQIKEPLPRLLVSLTCTWLIMFFGRATWGQLLRLLAVPSDLHTHRFQAAFELCAVLAGAWGLHRIAVSTSKPSLRALAGGMLAVALAVLGNDRATYLQQNATWGRSSSSAQTSARADVLAVIADVQALLAKKPGRASAGLAAGWGGQFKVGLTPFYGLLSQAHVDQTSFLYHSMSRTSDVMVLRDEANLAHVDAFALRVLVAPDGTKVPEHFKRYAQHGRFVVYEGSSEGYFGLTDITGVYTGPADTRFEPSRSWLNSTLPHAHQVIALSPSQDLPAALPRIARWSPFPTTHVGSGCGQIQHETKSADEIYSAELQLERDCHALFKVTWDPKLVAHVDGNPTQLLEVTPGFAAIPVPAGKHTVTVHYQPGPLRPLLLIAGLLAFAIAISATRYVDLLQLKLANGLEPLRARVQTATARTCAGFVLLTIVALRPLFHGKLVAGHDATEYPPRLVELARSFADGHFPPVWAADLGTGYGQPLFEFAPPLVYLSALPFYSLGAKLTNALQWGLVLLHTLGAFAIYRLARGLGASSIAALGVVAAWLFAPYTALDLYVRGAFAEASAFAMAPLASWLLHRCISRGSLPSIAAAAVSVALVILGHNGAAILIMPALCALVLGLQATTRGRIAGASAVALGLGLSAYFWLPALLEKSFVKTDLLREGFLHWSQHSVSWRQLLYSPWGHGLSGVGTDDGMSFAVGIPQLLLAAGGLLVALRARGPARRFAVSLSLVAFVGMFLATTSSSAIWQRAPTLQYLAYPWRALMLPGLCLPLLSVWLLARLRARWQLLAIAVVVCTNIGHTEPRDYLTFDEEYYAPESIAQKGITTSTREEYAPRTAQASLPFTPIKLLGEIDVLSQQLATAKQELRVQARAPTRAELATLAYPGWTARIDGSETPVEIVPQRGTMAIDVPAGEHTVTLTLEPTPIRRGSAWLSLLVALTTLAVVCLSALQTYVTPTRQRAPASEVFGDQTGAARQ